MQHPSKKSMSRLGLTTTDIQRSGPRKKVYQVVGGPKDDHGISFFLYLKG